MNTHIINKQIIELKVNSAEHAYGFQMQAREAYMSNLLPLIGELLDEIAGPDEVIRIDRLELDLGIINPGRMSEQMKARLREALLKQLPDLQKKNSPVEHQSFSIIEKVVDGKRNKAQLMSESFSQRELLAIYFETGFLPWWAGDEISEIDVDEMIISLLKKEPVTTLQWLQQLALKSPVAIRRMIMQVEKTTSKNILAVFPATVISGIQSLANQLKLVKKNITHFALDDVQAESILFTALILPAEIVNEAAAASDNKKILEALISQIAVIYRIAPVEIEKQLYADTLSENIFPENKTIKAPDLVDYFVEWEKKHPEIAASVTGNDSPALEIFTGNDQQSISKLVETIEQALKIFEEKQTVYFKRRNKTIEIRKRKSSQPVKKNKSKQQIVSAEELTQDNKDKILPYEEKEKELDVPEISFTDQPKDHVKEIPVDDDSEFDQPVVKINWFKAENENSAPERITGNEEFNHVKKSSSENPAKKEPELKEITIHPESKQEEKTTATNEPQEKLAEQNSLQEIDEIEEEDFLLEEHPLLQKKPSTGMTRYGGLVIIAPFLPAFFSELKLIDDGKFISEAEQYKALHLLNFLATGKTSSPEYALLLHKLLCGIEITQPVPKKAKLSAAEKKEAILFLDDIAGQWTALRSTSGIAFRDTFFKRNGILDSRDKSWLLRVERGPMDIMLDTLPWTLSIIRLPWMQQLLQVEW